MLKTGVMKVFLLMQRDIFKAHFCTSWTIKHNRDTTGCFHPCHADVSSFIIRCTPTHSFGSVRACVNDVYFHCSCVKLLLWFSWGRWLQTVSREAWGRYCSEVPPLWLHDVSFILDTLYEKKTLPLQRFATNKCIADVTNRINHKNTPQSAKMNPQYLFYLSEQVIIKLKEKASQNLYLPCDSYQML